MACKNSEVVAEDDKDARLKAYLAECEAKSMEMAGFDNAQDRAALIVRFFAAQNNRYSEDHRDRVLGPILRRASKRYGECRRYNFMLANRIAQTEAVREILALDLEKSPRRRRVPKAVAENGRGEPERS